VTARLIPDLDEELTAALGHAEELLLSFAVWEDEEPGTVLPAPLAGRVALEAVRRLWDAVAPTQGGRAVEAGRTGRMLAPDGRYYHLPLRLADAGPADVAALAAAARALGDPHAGDDVRQALEVGDPHAGDDVRQALEDGAVIAYGTDDDEACTRLVARVAQIAGLLDLAPDGDTETLRALVDAAGPGGDVVLSPDSEAAYQRYAARANAMWALSDPIARYLY
jgi:hypothetical protein